MNQPALSDYVTACFAAAGCTRQIVGEMAMDALFHISQGIPRVAGKLLTTALRVAHEQEKDIICERIIEQARELVLA